MRAIDSKLWRDVWAMRMQALAIAVVIVGGVAIYIMSLSTLHSLYETRERYYRDHHFAHVFSTLERAPLALVDRIRGIPGVDKVDARVVAYVSLDVEGFDDPVSGHLVSLPERSAGLLNRIYLRRGRLLEADRDDEVLLSEEFARAHSLAPGDTLRATINGRRKKLTVVGHALSPEYIYQIAPGAMFPDYERYGVLWMARAPLAAAYDMEGAFNDVALTVSRGHNPQDVVDRVDDLLERYGGTGAILREDQLSNRFLSEELKQQQTVATVFPTIFFGVAAFLLNVVISRLVSLEREQVAVLKAFGYGNAEIGLHYAKMVLLIVALGIVGGIVLGIWMGKGLSAIYMQFFSLPFMAYTLRAYVVVSAAAIAVAAALLGTVYALRRAARLPPAEAMRPEPPAVYRATFVERLGVKRWLSQPSRMVVRHIERRPLKSALTILGVAAACGVMVISGFQEGAIDYMVKVQYSMSQREDLLVNFTDPTSGRALYSLRSLPGVEHVEGIRSVPARLRFEHRSYRTSVQGIASAGELMRLLDTGLDPIEIPPQGVVLTDYLAQLLRIAPGDMLTVEVLEGRRPTVEVPVVGTARQYLGMNAYMQHAALGRLLGESDAISSALLSIDARYQQQIYDALEGMPQVAGVVEQKSAIRAFYGNVAQSVLFYTFVSTLLGASIAFGVVYNSMRIALSERNRELASLRVLGFERGEVAYILLGELALLTLIAIPIGFAIGYGLSAYLAFRFGTDLYRVPLVLDTGVYAFAAAVVIGSSLISGIIVWRNLAHLDMVAVLKTKE